MAVSGSQLVGQVRLAMRTSGEASVAGGADKVAGSMDRVRLKLAAASEMAEKARANFGLISGLAGGLIGSQLTSFMNPQRPNQETAAGQFASDVAPGITSLIGAVGGQAVGDKLAGAAGRGLGKIVGSSIGGVIGGFLGPLGAIVGMGVGSLVGSLVGPALGDMVDSVAVFFGAQTRREKKLEEIFEQRSKDLARLNFSEAEIRELARKELEAQERRDLIAKNDLRTRKDVEELINSRIQDEIGPFSTAWEAFTEFSPQRGVMGPLYDLNPLTLEERLENAIERQQNEIKSEVNDQWNATLRERNETLMDMLEESRAAYRY